MASTCWKGRRETGDLGLPRDFNLQTRREVFGVRSGLGPAISHLLSQICDRDVSN